MNLKKIAGTAVIAGALGAASLALGAGSAQADPDWVTRTFVDSGAGRLDSGTLGSGNQLGPAWAGQEMVPLALPARSLERGSTRDSL